MLNTIDKGKWLSLLDIPANSIPDILILRGTRNLKKKYHEHKVYFDNIVEVNSPNGVVEDVFLGNIDGVSVAYASIYGAPMASEVTHIFGVLGTKLVIQTGCCGGIGSKPEIGDIICPTSAYCGEGASKYYSGSENEVKVDSGLINIIRNLISETVPVHYGPIYTTSALFAENPNDIELWKEKGYIAVDMETSATFTVAKHFGMDYLSLLYVFDNPHLENHILTSTEESAKKRAEGEMIMLGMVLTIIETCFKEREG